MWANRFAGSRDQNTESLPGTTRREPWVLLKDTLRQPKIFNFIGAKIDCNAAPPTQRW